MISLLLSGIPLVSELPSGIRAEKAQSSFVYMINFFSSRGIAKRS